MAGVGGVRDTVAGDLVPGGVLRAAINLGNPVLAQGPAAAPAGVTVDIARQLGARLGVAVDLACFTAARESLAAMTRGDADICFLAIEPARAAEVAFTAPYVVIEGAYLVTEGSPIRDNAEVDRPGVRLMVSTGSAYDLFLSRTIRDATIVRTAAAKDVVDVFVAEKLDVAAGVRPALEADARRVPGLRLLPGRFMAIHQAMGTPRGRNVAARYLHTFIEEMKATGFIASSLARNRIEGASVAGK